MNKTDLVNRVAEEVKLTKRESAVAVSAVLDAVQDALVKGEKVQLVGFGSFEVRDRAERKGRNPQNGEEITIPATKVPSFKAGKVLKDAVN